MKHDMAAIVVALRQAQEGMQKPIVTELVERTRDPYLILISTILSLRTKDEVTREASLRLFERAGTPQEMIALDEKTIAELIYPVGFYRNKAATVQEVSAVILERYGGVVPDDIDELLKLKGVGRKTANLVVTMGYGKPGICVDTHVHRIMNRIGYVSTSTPNETEYALRKKLPTEYWIEINDLLVTYGQNVCKPISPLCSQCAIHQHCRRIGVIVHR